MQIFLPFLLMRNVVKMLRQIIDLPTLTNHDIFLKLVQLLIMRITFVLVWVWWRIAWGNFEEENENA